MGGGNGVEWYRASKNYYIIHCVDDIHLSRKYQPLKLCTFSRVMKEKGIENAIIAVTAINEKYGKILFTLDIYGQIEKNQNKWFDNLRKKFPKYINYRGTVSSGETTLVLKEYFALLFPSYYDGEGFAGTLIDALAAGVPVIASNWRYNGEIVKDGQTGIVYQLEDNDNSQLLFALEYVLDNIDKWNKMKIECIKNAEDYSSINVVQTIISRIVNRITLESCKV